MPSFTLKRCLSTALVCLLAVVMLGASPSADPSARFGRIGHNMMCVCGCGQILLECNHVGCPDSARMIGELHDQLDGPNGGGGDSLVENWFVSKYGAVVLAAPLRGGFDNVAWIVPLAIFLLATIGTAMLIRMWSQRRRLALPGALPPSLVDDEIRARIRRETEY